MDQTFPVNLLFDDVFLRELGTIMRIQELEGRTAVPGEEDDDDSDDDPMDPEYICPKEAVQGGHREGSEFDTRRSERLKEKLRKNVLDLVDINKRKTRMSDPGGDEGPVAKKRRLQAISNGVLGAPPMVPSNLQGLIQLAEMSRTRVYRDCQSLPCIEGDLKALNNMVGIDGVKQKIFCYIMLRLQRKTLPLPLLNHVILSGPPGAGKTTLVRILARILAGIGAGGTSKVVVAKRHDLIAGYLGQTAEKTRGTIEKAYGGVLLLDEISAMTTGDDSSHDTFLKESIDTLNQALSEDGDKFTCIIAGYRKEILGLFLETNAGLSSRFPNHWTIEGYSETELASITMSKLAEKGVNTDGIRVDPDIFSRHRGCFLHFARSCELLVDTVIEVHALEVFGKDDKTTLSQETFDRGVTAYVDRAQATPEHRADDTLGFMYT